MSESITKDDEEANKKRFVRAMSVECRGSMRRMIVLTSLVTLIGCATTSWRMEYLKEGLGRVSQDDVTLKMGPPMSADSLSTRRNRLALSVHECRRTSDMVP